MDSDSPRPSMRWVITPEPSFELVDTLSKRLSIHKTLAKILIQRGVDTYDKARLFFSPTLQDLHDPFLMKDMRKAIDRIEKALEAQERILIYGDYDVDGTTAVSLLYSFLKNFTSNIATYIPDRYTEGYGISFKGIDYAHDNDFTLVITLDCGIRAVDKVAYAKDKGIDIIIADHHLPGTVMPEAYAILDPKQEDCPYPYKELCGCGIGFKMIQAMNQSRSSAIEDLVPYLDLVAIAIGADIVPITGENRVLALLGLKVINTNPRVGIKALIENLKKDTLTITDVVFVIAPRINAAGRIFHGDHAVKLLTEFNIEQAQQTAFDIEKFNKERKELDEKITQEGLQQIVETGQENKFTTIVYHQNWHKGVIGIVASRLIETYYKPTLVFTESNGKMVASARSVNGFDIHHALEQCSDHIEQFGGHKYAAGLTVSKEKFEVFKDCFETVVSQTITEASLQPELEIDTEINFSDFSPKFLRILNRFEPFGPGNQAPVFMSKQVFDTGYAKSIGKDHKHLKVFVRQQDTNPVSGVGFGLGNRLSLLSGQKRVDLAYSVEENYWNGQTSIQLKIRDIR